MVPTDGFALLTRIRAEGIDTPVVVLTMSDAQEDLARAFRAGVRGYLLKDMDPDEVIDAIRRTARGEVVVAPMMAIKLVDMLLPGEPKKSRDSYMKQLTEREREILQHLSARQEQQGDRACALHQPRHGEAARPPHPVQARADLAGRGCGIRGRAPRGVVRDAASGVGLIGAHAPGRLGRARTLAVQNPELPPQLLCVTDFFRRCRRWGRELLIEVHEHMRGGKRVTAIA